MIGLLKGDTWILDYGSSVSNICTLLVLGLDPQVYQSVGSYCPASPYPRPLNQFCSHLATVSGFHFVTS